MQLINRAYVVGLSESQVVGMLSDLEANAFDSYIQTQVVELGVEPLSLNQLKRFKESISKWESALVVCNLKRAG